MQLLKNQIIRLNIIEINKEGLGVANHNGFPVMVANALPGEVIDANVIEISTRGAIAELVEIIKPSENRIAAPCQIFSKCGGCSLQHLSNYHEYKLSIFKDALLELNFSGTLHQVAQIPVNSRRRAVFKISNNKLSFNQFNSNQVISVANCLLLEDSINALILPINRLLNQLRLKINMLSVMNSDTGIELLFHSEEKGNLKSDSMFASFAIEHNIARIAWQIKAQTPFAIIQTKPVQLLFENTYVDLPINSFLQVSKESIQIMSNIILRYLTEKQKILELYCGCGSFTIPMSKKGFVFAVEGSEVAIEALNKTIKRDHFPIKAIKQDLYHNPLQPFIINDYSQVVINPPRNGATPQIKQIALASSVKKVILISCSVTNFIRDVKILLYAGFILEDVYPIDQFLYTNHLEVIAILTKS